MNCNEFEQILAEYAAGFLSGADKEAMDAHRKSCPSCARLSDMHRVLNASLNTAERVSAPTGFADRILAAVGETEVVAAKNTDKSPDTALTCETFKRFAIEYTDGALPEIRMAAMTAHRKSCKSCDALAKAHRAVILAFESAEPVPAPASFSLAVETAAKKHEHIEKVAYGWEWFGIAAASIAAFGSLLTFSSSLSRWLTSFIPDSGYFTSLLGNARAHTLSRLAPYIETLNETSTIYSSKALSLLTTPVTIPYLDVSVAPYYIAATLILATYFWYYIEDADNNTAESSVL